MDDASAATTIAATTVGTTTTIRWPLRLRSRQRRPFRRTGLGAQVSMKRTIAARKQWQPTAAPTRTTTMMTLINVNQNSRFDFGARSIGPHEACVACMRAILLGRDASRAGPNTAPRAIDVQALLARRRPLDPSQIAAIRRSRTTQISATRRRKMWSRGE
jgi:hypothetical protein